MRFLKETILLGFIGFTTLIIAISMSVVIERTTSEITSATGMFGVSAQVNPLMVMINNVFWLVCILSFVGMIVLYLIGSHWEERERYEYYER